jgi:hypothetical protein
MTMTEATEVKAPARRKKKTRRAAPKAAPVRKADDAYAGLTVKDCCHACNIDACVISGRPYCAHPRKGGLHPEEMNDSAALRRRKEAENKLRDQLLAVR